MKITKGCPCCGAVLEIRVSRRQGSEYLGCPRPGCGFKAELPVDLLLRRQGAPELPLYAEVS
jgi:hypothetical protein